MNTSRYATHPALPVVPLDRQDARNRLMIDLEGTQLTAEDRTFLSDPRVGAVILFTRNALSAQSVTIEQSRQQLRTLCDNIHALRDDIRIGVDHEGGRVQRFRHGFSEIPSMRSLGALYHYHQPTGLAAAKCYAALMAQELRECGVDFTFAPVLDLDYDANEAIGNRAFSPKPATVIALAQAFCEGLHQAGMPAIGKHFPGHGFVGADSHTSLPIDNRTLNELVSMDLIPFGAHGTIRLDAIMMAHVVYSQIDQVSAGYSKVWLDYLRQTLDFDGLVFSDDLSMIAAHEMGDIKQRCYQSMMAGCDVLIVCNDRQAVRHLLTQRNDFF